MSPTKFTAVFERDEAGLIYAQVLELPEVQTQGSTLEEAREMVPAPIKQALELRQARGEPIHATSRGLARIELREVDPSCPTLRPLGARGSYTRSCDQAKPGHRDG